MDIGKLQRTIIDALEDVKGHEIKVFNTTGLTGLFDRIIIASGTSNRQTKALAASVRDKVKEAGGTIVGIEGEESGEWVLVDLGDAVVHIMQPTIRSYYNLEELWGAKPVALRPPARKASASAPSKKAAVGKASKKTPSTSPPRKIAATKAATKPRKAAAKKSAA